MPHVFFAGQQRLGVLIVAPLSHLGPHKAPKGHSSAAGCGVLHQEQADTNV